MRVNREQLLKVLESVAPGLASREILEQSSCFVFHKGRVVTFNDAVACSRASPLNIQGAVKAKPLLDLLSKLDEDELDIEVKESELIVHGARRKAGIRMEAQVMLPIESVDVPDTWRKLDPDFSDAIDKIASCASSEESQFVLTCVHIHPDWMEACDRFQIARYPMKTGVEKSILVKAASLRRIVGYDMTEVSETVSWIHFKNPSDLVISCRRYLDDYKEVGKYLTKDGTEPVTLPGNLEDVVSRSEVFSIDNATGNNLIISLRENQAMIRGEGTTGWYREAKEIKYSGPPVTFLIAPKLLLEVAKRSTDVRIGEKRIFFDTGKMLFTAATEMPVQKTE